MQIKYKHDEVTHNLVSPSIIVPLLIDFIQPASVVDVGCGIGTFLNQFKENGIENLLGFDGEWLNIDLLEKYIDKSKVQIVDLQNTISIDRKFDLAISLEVAEHVEGKYADIFVENLIKLSDVIVFSAAFPGQGGQNHVNEQWPDYWINKFKNHNYQVFDVLRSIFWDDERIDLWYRQNTFLFIKYNYPNLKEVLSRISMYYKSDTMSDVIKIHPQYGLLIQDRLTEYRNIKTGKMPFFYYVKLLIKSFLFKLKIRS